MTHRTQKQIGRELEAKLQADGGFTPAVCELEREFWATGEREKRRGNVQSLRVAVFAIATERGATPDQAVAAVKEAEAEYGGAA